MRIRMTTTVAAPAPEVFAGMDEALLRQLSPPYPRARVLRFEGSRPGHQVHIRLGFGLFSTLWHSCITHETQGPPVWQFVDEGTRLPFFLSRWRHAHRVHALPGGGSAIEDDAEFGTPWWLPAPLVWLGLWGYFAYRRPRYRRRFGRTSGGGATV
jgi:ligand-binding SRPBCC domain-containing protein